MIGNNSKGAMATRKPTGAKTDTGDGTNHDLHQAGKRQTDMGVDRVHLVEWPEVVEAQHRAHHIDVHCDAAKHTTVSGRHILRKFGLTSRAIKRGS